MQRVLATDGEQRSTLAVVRSLGASGYEVHVTSLGGRSLAGASRFCASDRAMPDPMVDAAGYADAVAVLLETLDIDVLIPMTDVAAVALLPLRSRCPDTVIPFPEQAAWENASDKRRLLELAKGLGVPVPNQVVIERRDDDARPAIEWATGQGFPIVLKPHCSAVVDGRAVRKLGVSLAASAEEMQSKLASLPEIAFPVLVQQRIQGPGVGGFFLASHGEAIASFAHRRLREKPPTGGVSVLRESVAMAEQVLEHSTALLRELDWSGVAMVEFKQDATTGTYYLMEINGRFWGSLQLAIDAGVDFPPQLLDVFRGRLPAGEATATSPYALGVRSRWLWGDFDHLLWILRAPHGYRRRTPSLPSRLEALGRFLLPWTPGQRLEVLRISDPRPFLRESRGWFGSLRRRLPAYRSGRPHIDRSSRTSGRTPQSPFPTDR